MKIQQPYCSYQALAILASLLISSGNCHLYEASPRRCLSQGTLVCNFSGTSGNSIHGYVLFRPVFRPRRAPFNRCRVLISARVNGLSPGPHGFHVHTYGDERSQDGSSTGGHFLGPGNVNYSHGYPRDFVRHWGDFGNIIANSNGLGRYRRVDRLITLYDIMGRGMVIHANRDVGSESQPSGDSGPRQATCVIGLANPEIR